MTHANMQRFFEENPMNHFVKRGLMMYPLGGYSDDTGTYGPFNQFVTEEQGHKIGQIIQEYEDRRNNTERIGWGEIMQDIAIFIEDANHTHNPIEKKWTTSNYPSKIPLPNEKFDENIENVILWNMMNKLEKQEFKNWRNDPNTGSHTGDGWMNPSKLCSKIFLEDNTELYVSTKFYSEPELNITEIKIDDSRPTDCQKWFWIPYDVIFENGIMVFKYDD